MKKVLSLVAIALMQSQLCANASDKLNFDPNLGVSKDEITVPISCNATMTFIKVYTSGNKASKAQDKQFNAGHDNDNLLYAESVNKRYIQGGFHDDKGYYYLISKYELTDGQFNIINQKDEKECKDFSKKDLMAKSKISYFEAIDTAKNLTLLLKKSSKDNKGDGLELFKDNEFAYVRLPTDEEWEFAARGGQKVSPGDFNNDLPPMSESESIGDYVWSGDSNSANKKKQIIGLKKPNPLGLYDILGNVKEMTQDPFKAVGAGRLLGLSGGMTVRGGSFKNPSSSITSSTRSEMPYYDPKKGVENKADDVGVRFVIANSVLDDKKAIDDLNDSIKKLGSSDESDNSLHGMTQGLDKVILDQKKKLEQYEKEKKDLALKNKKLDSSFNSLEDLNKELKENNEKLGTQVNSLSADIKDLNTQLVDLNAKLKTASVEREEFRDKSIESNIKLGGFLCGTIKMHNRSVDMLSAIVDFNKARCAKDQSRCDTYEKLKKQLESTQEQLKSTVQIYGDSIFAATSNYSGKEISNQIDNAKQAYGSNSGFYKYVDLYVSHLEKYRKQKKDAKKNTKMWQDECQSLKVQ